MPHRRSRPVAYEVAVAHRHRDSSPDCNGHRIAHADGDRHVDPEPYAQPDTYRDQRSSGRARSADAHTDTDRHPAADEQPVAHLDVPAPIANIIGNGHEPPDFAPDRTADVARRRGFARSLLPDAYLDSL